MIIMQGLGISRGVAWGPVRFLRRMAVQEGPAAGTPQQEAERFRRACEEAAHQLEALAERGGNENNPDAAQLFETHALLAQDEDFAACALAAIEDGQSAFEATAAAAERFAAMLTALEDGRMQERAADVQDVARRIQRCLTGGEEAAFALTAPAILAADDLSPSETMLLDRAMLKGILLRGGSSTSHTAILARTMGIPAICSLGEDLREDCEGREIWLDGENGTAILEPDAQWTTNLRRKQREQESQARQMRGLPDVTLCGRRVPILCNIAAPEEAEIALRSDGAGVGLYRSEMLYLASDELPDEETQYRTYRQVVQAMQGRRVVIRTLDAGADKRPACLHMSPEENPALGVRGVRMSLTRPELLCTQLRALYRASAHGRLAILLPMIASVWEVRECRVLCREVMMSLEQEGVPFDRGTEIGVMIETPAAVLTADMLAREADFFSIGTNDLTQYILACDRQSAELSRFADAHHPAILRAIAQTADAAHAAGIPVCVCGDMAADEEMLPALLRAGVDSLSVPPGDVLRVRSALRQCNLRP